MHSDQIKPAPKSTKKMIMIDVDGVLAKYDGKYDPNKIGDPAPQAQAFCVALMRRGFDLAAFSTRDPRMVEAWLHEHGFPKDMYTTCVKWPAVLYIDDRAVQHTGKFAETLAQVQSFEVWWKKSKSKPVVKTAVVEPEEYEIS